MKRWIPFLLLIPHLVFAQQELEIIPLQHRSLEQMLPALDGFVEPGGTLSGMNDRLIIRASRRNIEEIKALVASLDTPPRRLQITVSTDLSGEDTGQHAGISGKIATGNRAHTDIEGHLSASTQTTRQHAYQTLQVIEGGSGYIVVGQSFPLPLRQIVSNPQGVVITDSVIYQDIGSGFYVIPRVLGDNVTLSISPQLQTMTSRGQGGVNTQRLETTVYGKLGEWIKLGGSTTSGSRLGQGYTSYSTRDRQERLGIWLKVDEVQ
jgi:type II secretory pathway component GspD/PulD (secretin)